MEEKKFLDNLENNTEEIRKGDKVIYKGHKYQVLNLKKVRDDEYVYFLGGVREWARRFQIRLVRK